MGPEIIRSGGGDTLRLPRLFGICETPLEFRDSSAALGLVLLEDFELLSERVVLSLLKIGNESIDARSALARAPTEREQALLDAPFRDR